MFAGLEDRVICFHCGGGLRHWKKDDDPWKEHAKWNPKCEYVLMIKGPGFVENVVKGMTTSDYVDLLMKKEPATVCDQIYSIFIEKILSGHQVFNCFVWIFFFSKLFI